MKRLIFLAIFFNFFYFSSAQELKIDLTDEELFQVLDYEGEDVSGIRQVKSELTEEFMKKGDDSAIKTIEQMEFEQFIQELANEMISRFKLKNNETPYHYIAKTGKLKYLRLTSYFSNYTINTTTEQTINSKIVSSDSPLHYAISRNRSNQFETVKALVEKGADITLKDVSNNTCLHLAAQENNMELVQYFVESGIKVNDANIFDNTALHFAAYNNNKSMIDLLLAKGASLDNVNFRLNTRKRKDSKDYSTILHTAVMNNWTDIIDKALGMGVSIDCKVHKSRYYKNATPLLYAVDEDNTAIAKYLVEKGADVNLYEYTNGYTPLTKSIFNENKEIFDLLVARKADINIPTPNRNGFPIYHCFHHNDIELGHYFAKTILSNPDYIHPKSKEAEIIFNEMYALLLAERAKMQMTSSFEKDIDDKSPLHWCAIFGWGDLCEVIIKGGADVNVTDKNGATPLQKAVQYQKYETAKVLMQNNANPKLKNKNDKTAFDIAKDKKDSEMKKILNSK
jgi:ankyrin repeat protein